MARPLQTVKRRQTSCGQFAVHGFHAYEIVNDEKEDPYLKAVRSPQRPRRIYEDTDLDHEAELIFSRIDAALL